MNSDEVTGNVGSTYALLPKDGNIYVRSWRNVEVLSPGQDAQNGSDIAQYWILFVA